MYRVLPVSRRVPGQAFVRVPRRRLATETPSPAPPKKKRIVRRIIFYTTAALGTFYTGSAFLAFNNEAYHNVFVERVPLGSAFMDFAEARNWDTLTLEKVIDSTKDSVAYLQRVVTGQPHPQDEGNDVQAQGAANRVKQLTSSLFTTVEKNEEKLTRKQREAAAIAKHRADQFSEGVDELVAKAEAALQGKFVDRLPGATNIVEQPASSPPDSNSPPESNTDAPSPVKVDKPVYDDPLPIGFEPPPSHARPTPPKVESPPKPEPLPLVAPAVSELSTSEPVISQLASTIDNLASYLNSNPAAATKAKDVLETAKEELTELADRIDKVREEERYALEQKLDEQTREYTLQLLELEMQSQDKLESQEDEFKKFFEQERLRLLQLYQEKLDRELATQTELINERLKEEVIAQGIEMQRRWIREIKVRVEQERGGRLAKLDELATSLKRLERIALDNSSYLDENIRVHTLWSALRSLTNTIDAPARKPFREELRVLRHIAAAREDPVVVAALDSLEATDVPDIGVEPFADLASWFTTSVAPRLTSVALVPDQNAGVLSHLASHLLASFRFQRQGLVPGSDVLSVIARAEYHMNEKDLDSAARELNQLKGTAKVLLADWLEAARRRLEVLQALEVVQAQATLASLLVV